MDITKGIFISIALALVFAGTLLATVLVGEEQTARIAELNLVQPDMPPEEVLAILGQPENAASGIMADSTYGLPIEVKRDIVGIGTPYEVWHYEAYCPAETHYASVWLAARSPGSESRRRVIYVHSVLVRRSLWFRFCDSPLVRATGLTAERSATLGRGGRGGRGVAGKACGARGRAPSGTG